MLMLMLYVQMLTEKYTCLTYYMELKDDTKGYAVSSCKNMGRRQMIGLVKMMTDPFIGTL